MELAHLLIKHLAQLIDILLFACRDKEAVVLHLCHPCALKIVERYILTSGRSEIVRFLLHPCISVNLVEDNHRRFVGTSEVGKCFLHNGYLLLKVGMGYIHHMQQQVGLAHLIEG